MSTETDWPFDAYQDDPLTVLRIPVVGTLHPGWKYEVALCCPDSEAGQWLYPSLRPDDAEVRQIVAEIEWRMTYYNDRWKAGMRKRPLDVDGSTNTVVLQKRPNGGWCYRRMTWQTGPMMVPPWNSDERLTLEQVLDRINDYHDKPNPKWREFKAEHPEAFPVTTPAAAGTEES